MQAECRKKLRPKIQQLNEIITYHIFQYQFYIKHCLQAWKWRRPPPSRTFVQYFQEVLKKSFICTDHFVAICYSVPVQCCRSGSGCFGLIRFSKKGHIWMRFFIKCPI